MGLRQRKYLLGCFVAGLACSCTVASAQDGSNVLVAVEATSRTSERIAARYAQARRIPAENVVPLKTAATDEVSRAQNEEQIEGPIAAWIRRIVCVAALSPPFIAPTSAALISSRIIVTP